MATANGAPLRRDPVIDDGAVRAVDAVGDLRVGAVLAAVLAMWIGVSGLRSGEPWPMVGLVLGVTLTVAVAARVTRAHTSIIPVIVGLAPLLSVLITPRSPIGDGPLGYANSSGALYLLAAAAAVTAARLSDRPVARSGWYVLAGLWAMGPILVRAGTASLGLMVMAVTLWTVTRREHVRAVLVGGAAVLVATLLTTLALALDYAPGGRASAAARLFDTHLGQIRIVLWHEAVTMLQAAPVWGVGPGRFAQLSPSASRRDDWQWAHSEYLQLAAETGWLGGILLVLLLGWGIALVWRRGPGPNTSACVVVLLVILVNAATDFIWHAAAVPLAAAALFGWLTAVPGRESADQTQLTPVARRLIGAGAVTIAIVAVPVAPSDLPATAPNEVHWLDAGGLRFPGAGGGAVSETPPIGLVDRLVAAEAFTVELTIASDDLGQDGPARIFSISEGTRHRNLTIAQEQDALIVRIRSTATDWNATSSSVTVPAVFDDAQDVHIVVASDLDETRVYLDGALRSRTTGPGGSLASWLHRYPLLLGNELTGNRPWAGRLYLLAVYDRALSGDRVAELHRERTGTSRPEAVALYRFAEGLETTVADQSGTGLAPALQIPSRFPIADAPQRDVLDVARPDLVGVAVHLVGFAVWAMLLYPLLAQRLPRITCVAGLSAACAGLSLTALALPDAAMPAPSLLDIGVAVVGVLLGAAITEGRRHGRP